MGWGLSKVDGNRHAFSLYDASISYPYRLKDTVSFGVLLIVSIAAPAVIIGAISLIFVPGPTAVRGTPPSLIWRRKLWECHTGWMGLGVALAGAFMVTEGLKDIYGKPRPDLLDRCQPDLAKLAQFVVGGLGQQLGEAPLVVDSRICQQTDNSILRDGFASFPSGHASFSWAGMTYLTLFLCAKFAITIPFLAPAADDLLDTAAFDGTPSTRRNGMGPCSQQSGSTTSLPPRPSVCTIGSRILHLRIAVVGLSPPRFRHYIRFDTRFPVRLVWLPIVSSANQTRRWVVMGCSNQEPSVLYRSGHSILYWR